MAHFYLHVSLLENVINSMDIFAALAVYVMDISIEFSIVHIIEINK